MLSLLRAEGIDKVIDVRSYPYSRFAPQFNRERLEPALRRAGVGYLYAGAALGGRPADESHYDEAGHALYGAMASTPAFQDAIRTVIAEAPAQRIALLCSEGKPHYCHRRLLVGKVLADRGLELAHILPDGSLWVEDSVPVGDMDAQGSLFGEEVTQWRSTQSVSQRRRQKTSSAG